MTKIEAIRQVLADHGGIANWQMIYNEIERYYPNAKRSTTWQAGIRGVLYRDISAGGLKKIDTGIFALNNFNEEESLIINAQEGATDKAVVVKVRTMQQTFRKSLLRELESCPITGVSFAPLLIASHIKPWNLANNQERLDVYNGFLFTPTYDKLFDQGYISFDFNKRMLLSSKLSDQVITQLQLNNKIIERLPLKGREEYLQFHQKNIFLG